MRKLVRVDPEHEHYDTTAFVVAAAHDHGPFAPHNVDIECSTEQIAAWVEQAYTFIKNIATHGTYSDPENYKEDAAEIMQLLNPEVG